MVHCGLFPAETLASTQPDRHDNCAYWAEIGECEEVSDNANMSVCSTMQYMGLLLPEPYAIEAMVPILAPVIDVIPICQLRLQRPSFLLFETESSLYAGELRYVLSHRGATRVT